MAKAGIKVVGFDLQAIQIKIDTDIKNIESSLNIIGNEIVRHIQSEIRQNTKRKGSTGDLASSIEATYIPGAKVLTVGVGDTDKMYKEAPYWFVVNYGAHFPGSIDLALQGVKGSKFIPPPNLGSFEGNPSAPQQGTSENQRWRHRTNGKYLIVPRKFRAMNYIEKTNAWLTSYWPRFWANRIK